MNTVTSQLCKPASAAQGHDCMDTDTIVGVLRLAGDICDQMQELAAAFEAERRLRLAERRATDDRRA